MFIFIAILAFGILILTHELGHFAAAKLSGVRVLEFAIGMGPSLLKKQGKETLYSLRLLPIGGYCAMEGEDDDSEDPRAFVNQTFPKRFVILIAGSVMNFLVGFLLILLVFSQAQSFIPPVITGFMEGCPYEGEQGLQVGDEIYKVNGERVYFSANFSSYVTRSRDNKVDLVLIRNGQKVRLNDFHMVPVPFTQPDGGTVMKYGLYFGSRESGPMATLKYSWYCALDFVRIVRMGLTDLLTGRAGIRDLTGVVGIVGMINETGETAPNIASALEDIAYLVAFIAINLAVVNLMPLPALDGGRVVGIALAWAIKKIFRRKPNPRIEGYVHTVGFVLLLGLLAFVMYNDIMRQLT